MGYCSSCRIFDAFSTAIEWIARNKSGIPNMLTVLMISRLPTDKIEKCTKAISEFLSTNVGMKSSLQNYCNTNTARGKERQLNYAVRKP